MLNVISINIDKNITQKCSLDFFQKKKYNILITLQRRQKWKEIKCSGLLRL